MARGRGQRSVRDADAIANADPLDALDIALQPISLPQLVTHELVPFPRDLMSQVEDLRTWHPEEVRPLRFTSGLPATPKQRPARTSFPGLWQNRLREKTAFNAPDRVLVCMRRQTRKEVLHARRKTGGGGRRRKPRRTWRSDIRC